MRDLVQRLPRTTGCTACAIFAGQSRPPLHGYKSTSEQRKQRPKKGRSSPGCGSPCSERRYLERGHDHNGQPATEKPNGLRVRPALGAGWWSSAGQALGQRRWWERSVRRSGDGGGTEAQGPICVLCVRRATRKPKRYFFLRDPHLVTVRCRSGVRDKATGCICFLQPTTAVAPHAHPGFILAPKVHFRNESILFSTELGT